MTRHGADEAYRERVYCYELYHQLRAQWGDFHYSLAGEIDKSGQPIFQEGPYAQSKPDLVVHEFGNMDRNLAIVEVKVATADLTKLTADIDKLAWYCQHADYFSGILLVYGNDQKFHRSIEAVLQHVAALPCAEKIHVLQHRGVGSGEQQLLIEHLQ